ncbi:IclR family transcriptional regulator [Streptomyces cadmiisoli]|uniref:IclR family transcriptional regulator n=1 Tax=Streptomyces cadmiisoli TaxID=2184053 RepID=UPI00364E93CD
MDNALRLIHMLRDEGELRLTDAADALGIGRSTAHRLLSMLVYRDFARRDETRRTYLPGAALTAGPLPGQTRNQELRRLLMPHLERLCHQVEESVNLMVRVGTHTRFLVTVEAQHVLHVGDRQGTVLPAHHSSGGKALLAELPDSHLAELYRSGPEPVLAQAEFDRLTRDVAQIRRCGHALNLEATEAGICAIGRVVRAKDGDAVAAVTISAPTVRFPARRIETWAKVLAESTARAGRDLPSDLG